MMGVRRIAGLKWVSLSGVSGSEMMGVRRRYGSAP